MGNLKTIRIEELERMGKYSQDLLESLKKGEYNKLYDLPKDDRANYDYMMPLLYAVYNENGTYAVYTYCAESIQRDTKITEEIIEKEPELLEGTPLSRDEDFIKKHIESKPEIAKYMSPLLRNNSEIITEITNTGNEEAILAIASYMQLKSEMEANPELRSDKEYMLNNMENNGEIIAFASEELKNDYDFLKEAYKRSTVAIDYTAEHTDEFGEKGLTAAKEVIIETSTDKAIKEFESEINKIQQKLSDSTSKDPDEERRLNLELKRLQRKVRFFERLQGKEIEGKPSIDQVKAMKKMETCCRLESEYERRIKQVLKIDTAIKEKQQVTTEDIKDTVTDFKEMKENPTGEMEGLKNACTDLTPEVDMIQEEEAPEQ